MSGDVQPRKRKDKKKRKDEGDIYGPPSSNEDVTIHLHKDGGTGGNICAKIVFFFLFSALIVLVSLIIKENQGLNELDNAEEESRFSQIFEGWVDKSVDEHDDHSPELHSHEDSNEDQEEYSEESNVEDSEEVQSPELEQEEDEDSAARSEEDDSQELSSSRRSEDESEAQEDEEDENSPELSEEKNDSSVEDDEPEPERSTEADDNEETSSEKESSKTENKDPDTKDLNKAEDATLPESQGADQPAKESSGLATKIGVGLALLTVAYNVFLRKRRSDALEKPVVIKASSMEEEEIAPSLSRRNTIVPPPTLQEVEQDLPEIEVEDEEYTDEEYSDEDSHSEHRSPREEYQELRTTYSRSLTPEGDFEVKDKNYEEEVLEDDIEEEEVEPEEDLDDDVDDDYNRYDEDEDEELLKRLEAKYGKLGRDINVGDELESDSDKDDYEHSDITNRDDAGFKEDLDAAQHQLDKGK